MRMHRYIWPKHPRPIFIDYYRNLNVRILEVERSA